MTNIKSISSMRLHRELGIGQKAAWFMLARLRKTAEMHTGTSTAPVEADESYFGGKPNMEGKRTDLIADNGMDSGA